MVDPEELKTALASFEAENIELWKTKASEEASTEAEQWAESMTQMIASGANRADDAVFYSVPSDVVPGTKVTVYYDRSRTILNGHNVVMHVGFNDWSEDKNLVVEPIAMEPAVELVEKTPEANATIAAVWMNVMDGVADSVVPPEVSKEEDLKDTDWMKAEVTVPAGALVLDFVCSDGGGMWDNNNRSDYHIAIKGAADRVGALKKSRAEDLLNDTFEQLKEDELEKFEKNMLRSKLKSVAKAKSMATIRRQREHVLYSVPSEVAAGKDVKIVYNPANTSLAGSEEVFISGGWNRWQHATSIDAVQMTPTLDGLMEATIPVPPDACSMNFVFHNGVGLGAIYDNRGDLDYYLPVSGGKGADGKEVVEAPLHVVHICVEMAPIAKVGGLGDVVTSLGRAIQDEGHKVEIILPKYDCMNYGQIKDMQKVSNFQWGNCNNNVFHGIVEELDVYFIEPENGFFNCGLIYGADYLHIPMTDPERFGFFSRAALEFLLQSGRQPDIVHCHDWQTGPVAKSYWEDYNPYGLSNPRVVFSIHNMNYGLPLIEEAMQFSNRCTTVSPTYALEISGEPAIAPHMSKFLGIRNGIDGDIWDPQVDPLIPRNFGLANIREGKGECKAALQSRCQLQHTQEKAIVGIVTRLTTQKGIHLIKHAIHRALERGCQVVLLGSAPDEKMQEDFEQLKEVLGQQYWQDARLHLYYDEALSHLIYAGSDMLIVPSMFEPCGLSQLIAMSYGTVPVVRRTGGLADTVFDVNHDEAKAAWEGAECNGFSFDGSDTDGMDYALNRAIDMWYDNREGFLQLQSTCCSQDWSWNRPALDYLELYHSARK